MQAKLSSSRQETAFALSRVSLFSSRSSLLTAFWLLDCRALSGVQSRSARRAESRGEGCISGVYFCLAATRTLATRKRKQKKKRKKKRRIVNVDQQQRRRSHGFACGLFCFRRLTVSAQHSLALPETHRNTALHLPVDLSSFFFQHSLTPRSGSHCVCLSLGDLARGKGI